MNAAKSSEKTLAEDYYRLQRENRRLREERDILKKAAAYFAGQTL